MNIQRLKELLEQARSNAYSASNEAENTASYAKDAETAANDLYYELDKIYDDLDNLTGFNPERLRDLRLVQNNLLRAATLAGKEMDRIVDGDGVDEDNRWSYLNAILQRVFQYDETFSVYVGFDKTYNIEYDFGNGAYTVARVKEETNG